MNHDGFDVDEFRDLKSSQIFDDGFDGDDGEDAEDGDDWEDGE